MRLTVFLLLVATCTVNAGTFAQKITVTGKNISFAQFINKVKQQTGYSIIYDPSITAAQQTVNLEIKDMPMQEALKQVLKTWSLKYALTDKVIVITKASPELTYPQAWSPPDSLIDVSGRIVNEKQEPIPGVTITVKGTAKNTQTDDNGIFTVRAIGPNAILLASCINCEPIEINVNNRKNLFFELKSSIAKLEEVTVSFNTGYQQISRERSTGAFSKPNDNIFKNRSTSQNIMQRLDGLIPGLTINNAPNATQVLIRGVSSVNGERAPLYVVDGMPVNDISFINPQDVADITVLKDAVAASIWGSRASNGVIVIVTKKGNTGKKIAVEYDGYINLQGRPDINYFPVLTSSQFIQAAKDAFSPTVNLYNTVKAYTNSGSVGIPPHEMILYNRSRGLISETQANASLDSLANINNAGQIQKYWYRNALLANHTVSVRGGGAVHAFYGSLAYTNTQSNRPGEKNQSYKINARQDFNFSKWLQLFVITDLTQTNTSSPRNITIDNRFLPYQLFVDEATGKTLSMPYKRSLSDSLRLAYEARSKVSLDYNPMDEVNYGYTKGDALVARATAGVTAKLVKGLRYEGTFGYIRSSNKTTDFDDERSYTVRAELAQFTVAPTATSTPIYYLPNKGGKYSVANNADRNWTVRNQLVYDYAWNGRKHQLTILAGQEAREQLSTGSRSTVRGYNEDLQTYATNLNWDTLTKGMAGTVWPIASSRSTLANDNFAQTEIQSNTVSYYANTAYTFNRKYTINGSWRIDESNLFGRDKSAQNRPVWAIGGKWLAGNEAFLQPARWINQLALRITYGITGNAPAPGTAASYNILGATTGVGYPNGVGLALASPANRELTWESTQTTNLGIDFSFLSYRLSGSIDLYQRKTDNLLGNLQTNGFTGFATITGNYGNMENKGVELSLNTLNITTRNFSWRSLLVMAYNKNKLTNLNVYGAANTGASRVSAGTVVGYPVFSIFSYDFAGLDTLGDPMVRLQDKSVTKAINVTKADDVIFSGTYQPVWSGGVTNMFSYKGFDLDVNIIYNLGHVMRRDVNSAYTNGRFIPSAGTGFSLGNPHAEFNDRWRKKGDEAFTNIPSYVPLTSTSTSRRNVAYYTAGNINVGSASFIKIRDITLAYNLPKHLIARIRTDAIRLRVQLSNLMLWKANKWNIDPEFQNAASGTRSMLSGQGTITFGVNVKL